MEPQIESPREVQLPKLENWGDDGWRERAACRGSDTRLFFPEKEDLSELTLLQKRRRQTHKDFTDPKLPGNMISQARLLCVKCPVRKDCLRFAIENGIVHGLYGGIPPRERRGLTVDNLGPGMPFSKVLTDLHRVRRISKRDKKVPLAQDLAPLLDVTTSRAEKMLRDNDFPQFV